MILPQPSLLTLTQKKILYWSFAQLRKQEPQKHLSWMADLKSCPESLKCQSATVTTGDIL